MDIPHEAYSQASIMRQLFNNNGLSGQLEWEDVEARMYNNVQEM